jgi:uncharacterized membrane protein YgdD (TMEM256/DUF423 family)
MIVRLQASVTAQDTMKSLYLSYIFYRDGPMFSRLFCVAGALFAGLSVIFSAAFAHLPIFASGIPIMVQTALTQQQFHALGLLVTGLALRRRASSRWLQLAGALMLAGMLLFSGNIYARSLLGWDPLRMLVPWGGGAWIAAWGCLAIGLAQGLANGDD